MIWLRLPLWLKLRSLSLSLKIPVLLGSLNFMRRLTTLLHSPPLQAAATTNVLSLSVVAMTTLPLPYPLSLTLCVCVCERVWAYLPVCGCAAAILDSSTPVRSVPNIYLAPTCAQSHCLARKSLLGARVSWESWFMGRIVAAHCSV